MTNLQLKPLQPGDELLLEAFLKPRLESSIFLLHNMRASGLIDQGHRFSGTYLAAFETDKMGVDKMVAVIAHYWNNGLVIQAPVYADILTKAITDFSKRPIKYLSGPNKQVNIAKNTLGLTKTDLQLDEQEGLYRLMLNQLIVPPKLKLGQIKGRRIAQKDLDLLVAWRVAYCVETLGDTADEALWTRCRNGMVRSLNLKQGWLVEENSKNGGPLAFSGFNAVIKEAVQVGGVWTPPPNRSQGYGRCAVATSLLDAQAEGTERAILFTSDENIAAQKTYAALGFKRIGDYRLTALKNEK